MTISFTKMETAKILGISTTSVDRLCRQGVFRSWFAEDADGRYTRHVNAKDVIEYARDRDGDNFLKYIKPRSPKKIRVQTIMDMPDEWYDEDYQKLVRSINDMYEQQRIDDMY